MTYAGQALRGLPGPLEQEAAMADVKITAPNSEFLGVRAGIGFAHGVAKTEVDPTDVHAKALLDWFARNGYEVDGPKGGWQIGDAPTDGAPAGNASRDAWAAYAESLGVYVGDMTRDEIRDAVAAEGDA